MKRLCLFLLCLLLVVSCDEEDSIYRGHRCYFIFDTTLHPAPCHLTGALGNPGHFLIVKTRLEQGVRHIMTTRNYDHAEEDVRLTTAKENQTSCQLGAGGAIIIGRSSYTGVLVCYEGQCSNCLANYGGTSYPLAWTANGQQLTCSRCHRCYDVNNGVVASGEAGRDLYTYSIAYDGSVLRAWN